MNNDAYVKQLESHVEKLESELASVKEELDRARPPKKDYIEITFGDRKYKIKGRSDE